MNEVLRFLREEEGPTAVEYAIMLLMIFMVAIAAITLFGQNTNESIDSSSSAIGAAVGK